MIFGTDNERLRSTALGMPMHAVYRWLAKRLGFDGDTTATTYFVLRRHGVTASEAWRWCRKGVAARDFWKTLPPERLSLADRVFLNSRTTAIDECLRLARRKRRNHRTTK